MPIPRAGAGARPSPIAGLGRGAGLDERGKDLEVGGWRLDVWGWRVGGRLGAWACRPRAGARLVVPASPPGCLPPSALRAAQAAPGEEACPKRRRHARVSVRSRTREQFCRGAWSLLGWGSSCSAWHTAPIAARAPPTQRSKAANSAMNPAAWEAAGSSSREAVAGVWVAGPLEFRAQSVFEPTTANRLSPWEGRAAWSRLEPPAAPAGGVGAGLVAHCQGGALRHCQGGALPMLTRR